MSSWEPSHHVRRHRPHREASDRYSCQWFQRRSWLTAIIIHKISEWSSLWMISEPFQLTPRRTRVSYPHWTLPKLQIGEYNKYFGWFKTNLAVVTRMINMTMWGKVILKWNSEMSPERACRLISQYKISTWISRRQNIILKMLIIKTHGHKGCSAEKGNAPMLESENNFVEEVVSEMWYRTFVSRKSVFWFIYKICTFMVLYFFSTVA